MLMKNKVGIRRVNLEKTYQPADFSTVPSTGRFTLHMGIEPVKSFLLGVQVREVPIREGKTRIEYRVVLMQTGFAE